jgi:hypothetical protein
MMNASKFISMMSNGKLENIAVKVKKVKLHEPISGLPTHWAFMIKNTPLMVFKDIIAGYCENCNRSFNPSVITGSN